MATKKKKPKKPALPSRYKHFQAFLRAVSLSDVQEIAQMLVDRATDDRDLAASRLLLKHIMPPQGLALDKEDISAARENVVKSERIDTMDDLFAHWQGSS